MRPETFYLMSRLRPNLALLCFRLGHSRLDSVSFDFEAKRHSVVDASRATGLNSGPLVKTLRRVSTSTLLNKTQEHKLRRCLEMDSFFT